MAAYEDAVVIGTVLLDDELTRTVFADPDVDVQRVISEIRQRIFVGRNAEAELDAMMNRTEAQIEAGDRRSERELAAAMERLERDLRNRREIAEEQARNHLEVARIGRSGGIISSIIRAGAMVVSAAVAP